MRLTTRHLTRLLIMLLPAFWLAACQTQTGGNANRPLSTSLVIDGIEGVPKALQEPLRDGLAKGAQRLGLVLESTGHSNSLHLRGYLTSGAMLAQGQSPTLVWDLFDGQENRIQRITSTASGGQTSLNAREAGQLAETSMDDLARFLKSQ